MPSTYEKQKRHIREAARVLDELKMAAGCMDCGFNAWPEALHFDHVNPATKQAWLGWYADRSKLTTPRRLDAYLAHVADFCVIRCANCHAHRTKVDGHHTLRHAPPTTSGPTLF